MNNLLTPLINGPLDPNKISNLKLKNVNSTLITNKSLILLSKTK